MSCYSQETEQCVHAGSRHDALSTHAGRLQKSALSRSASRSRIGKQGKALRITARKRVE